MIRSAHVDTFARDHLPAPEQWPDFLFNVPEVHYPDRLNCVSAFVDDWITAGRGDRECLISPTETVSYAGLAERLNRIANVLTRDLGVVPGNRVLLRGPNSPMMVAAYFAVIKAGGVVVATMPLLRAKEIAFPITKAEIKLALCDVRLADEMEKTRPLAPALERIVYWGSGKADSLEALMTKPGYERFEACDTASDDVCLIAFTSGTTGVPKGTMHFHRDMLAICDTFGKYVLRANNDDRFIGSPPIAFTFGLGGLVLFPLRVGAAAVLLERASPDDLLAGIWRNFAPPSASPRRPLIATCSASCRGMISRRSGNASRPARPCLLPHLRRGSRRPVSGPLTALVRPKCCTCSSVREKRKCERVRPVSRCPDTKPVSSMKTDLKRRPALQDVSAVRGPTGCRYLGDKRQAEYVQHGWNITGDTYIKDAEGYFRYQARSDDMIISAGYNIAGPEVETGLACASGGRRMRRCRSAGRRARPDREGLCNPAAGFCRRRGDDSRASGVCQSDGRAVQISACDRIRDEFAAHRNRQIATLRIATAGLGESRQQARVLIFGGA